MSLSKSVLLLSLIALVLTKAADFFTTVRYVGPSAELNPLARSLFARFGFRGGLAIVALIWTGIVAITYGAALWQASELYRWITAALGLLVSYLQWEAARFNAGGRAGRLTLRILAAYHAWALALRRRS